MEINDINSQHAKQVEERFFLYSQKIKEVIAFKDDFVHKENQMKDLKEYVT